jgi:ABC-type nitrate/sulfonate/bicarbonate transport system ATPase subunit
MMRAEVAPAKLETTGLVKRYAARDQPMHALAGVDICLLPGEFVCIIGPSGCGKSTLLNILSGLDEPTAGEVLIDGRRTVRRLGTVGYMPQKDLLMPWRTILDNTILGLEIAGVRRREARRRAQELFPVFGLGGFEKHYPPEISGGMRQRAALLRTFLTGGDIKLLDEPFGGLDSLTRAGMQQWLLDVWQRYRHTILFITHDIDEAIYLSDRVYVMSRRPGRIQLSLSIELERPRDYGIVTSDRFVELKQTLLSYLRLTPDDEEVRDGRAG